MEARCSSCREPFRLWRAVSQRVPLGAAARLLSKTRMRLALQYQPFSSARQNRMPLQPGTTLGPYRVTAKIGEGGMGEVYRARDTKLDRDVALNCGTNVEREQC